MWIRVSPIFLSILFFFFIADDTFVMQDFSSAKITYVDNSGIPNSIEF